MTDHDHHLGRSIRAELRYYRNPLNREDYGYE